jgi:15-cis-phytoene synthase
VTALINDWTARAAAAVSRAVVMTAERRARMELDARVAGTAEAGRFFRHNSRSFSLAATLFPASFRARVAQLYAFCRVTDDLADAAGDSTTGEQALCLDLWERQARAAYDGEVTGVALLDGVMSDAARAGVPFAYVTALFEGMRMDMRGERYETLDELRIYSYRVAGVIGQWLTRMCGVDDPWVLGRAAALGHALQLTNILRDVGEDARTGRIYIPAAVLAAHDIDADQLYAAARSGTLPPRWPALVEALMEHADRDYATALGAVGELPPYFRRAVVAAAHVYRGIHDEIRANGYDNLTRRAHTATWTKLRLAVRGLMGTSVVTGAPVVAPAGTVARTAAPTVARPSAQRRAAGAAGATGAAVVLALFAAAAPLAVAAS